MRQAIGSTWILQLVITFMLIFVAFLALSINYTKAFKTKNELITMIEKYEGLKEGDTGSIKLINNYLIYNNYSTKSYCREGEYGSASLLTPSLELADSKTKYYYCIGKVDRKTVRMPKRAKYNIRIFFKFNLPVLGDLFTFTVNGTTIDINTPVDNLGYTR